MFLAVYDVFPCVCTAGCRCSREDQPCVPGWEKRPGCDVLWPEALLWQHLPGVAVRGFWLSVAPSMGPLWVGLPRPGERYCTTEEDQARGDDISTAKAAGQGSWWTSVTYTDPVTPGSLFLKVYFFLSFPKTRSWKKYKKKDKYGSCDEQVWWHFFRFGEQNEKQTLTFWTFFLLLLFISTVGVYFSEEDALRF